MKMNTINENLREQLVNAAREHAESKGWAWVDPVEVTPASTKLGEETWVIRTNAGSLGRSVRVLIKEANQEIMESGFMSR